MNSVSLFGQLDSEPDLNGMPGRDVCEFWLTIPGRLPQHTAYIKVVAFRGLAERLAAELFEGDWVAVAGHLRAERWPGSRRHYRHTVVAREVRRAECIGGEEKGER
jgi:single-stranded DNA-binding protein